MNTSSSSDLEFKSKSEIFHERDELSHQKKRGQQRRKFNFQKYRTFVDVGSNLIFRFLCKASETSHRVEMGTQASKLPEFNDTMYSQPIKSVALTEKIHMINERRINVNRWMPEGTPKAVAVISHGLHEHGLRYHAVAEVLAREKYIVFALDHSSHGLSEGTRGLITDYKMLVMDFVTLCKECHEEFKELPFFVISHSVGTLVSIMSVNELPFLKVCDIDYIV